MLVLPGLEEYDAIELEPRSDKDTEICALTLDPLSVDNDTLFLKEISDVNNTVSPPLLKRARHLDKNESNYSIGIARLVACGHRFSGIQFIYYAMVGTFRCPVCRSGSNSVVDIKAPAKHLPTRLWSTLCKFAAQARTRAQEQEIRDEIETIQQIRNEEILAIQDMPSSEIARQCSYSIVFTLYKYSTDTTRRTLAASSVVYIPLQGGPNTTHDDAGIIEFVSGGALLGLYFFFFFLPSTLQYASSVVV